MQELSSKEGSIVSKKTVLVPAVVYRISNLLPHCCDYLIPDNKKLTQVLLLVEFLCKKSVEAINSFIKKLYYKFDAQVSENLCQVRAYQLFLLSHSLDKKQLQCEIDLFNQLASKVNKLLTKQKLRNSFRKKKFETMIGIDTLGNFLSSYALDSKISKEIFFLVQAYILSEFNIVGSYGISTGINYIKFCDETNILIRQHFSGHKIN